MLKGKTILKNKKLPQEQRQTKVKYLIDRLMMKKACNKNLYHFLTILSKCSIFIQQATINSITIVILLQILLKQNLLMNIDQKTFQQKQPIMCSTCKNFYASQSYKGLCSSCFKKSHPPKDDLQIDSLRKQSVDTQAQIVPFQQQKPEEVKQIEEPPKQVDRKRCYDCKKKVGLLGLQCKCGFVYCNTHRLPQQHACTFDHKKVANDRLKQALVKVYNGKLTQI